MSIKDLVGKKITKKTQFMSEKVEIAKLSVAEVRSLQDAGEDKEADDMEVLRKIIRTGVTDTEDLTDEDFDNLPLEELTKLAEAVMEFSGVGAKSQGK